MLARSKYHLAGSGLAGIVNTFGRNAQNISVILTRFVV